MKKQIKVLIGVIIAVVLIVALILVVTFLPSSNNDENNTSSYEDTSTTLLSKTPAEINKIVVKNQYGEFTILSETPTKETTNSETGKTETVTEATIYTLVGFEDMELASGQPDSIANDASSITALETIVDLSKKDDNSINSNISYNKADYGLEEPVATCTVIFSDGETHTIYVGNNVAGDSATYFMFDDRQEIFVGEVSSFDGFLFNVLSMFSTTVVEPASSDDDTQVTGFTLSGTAFANVSKSIEFIPVTDISSSSAYKMVYPINITANNVATTTVVNSVLNLIASEVVYVNPDEKALDEYKLLNPYSKIAITYKSNSLVLRASEPDEEGNCYLFNESKKLIYKISADKLPWVTTKYNDFMPETIISPYLSKINKITVDIGDKNYQFNVKTTTTVEDNVEKETTVITIGDKTLDTTNFRIYFQNISEIAYKGKSENTSTGDSLITIRFSYNIDNKDDDVISYYATDSATKINVAYQGIDTTYNFATYVNKIIEDTEKMANNGTISAVVQ